MKTRTYLKHQAQNEIMAFATQAILCERESHGGPDLALVAEMEKQAHRVGKLFGYTSYPGLGEIQ